MLSARQITLEGGAMAGLTVDPNVAPGFFDNPVNRRQSQPASLPAFFCCEERFKYSRSRGLIHPAPAIANRQHDVPPATHGVLTREGFVQIEYIGLDNQLSAMWHCIVRID